MPQAHSSPHDPADTQAQAASSRSLWKWGSAAVLGAALAGTALFNRSRAAQVEQDNPPKGRFLTVDGVLLHYVERGEGPPLVLLHGNGSMIEDWLSSGLLDQLARSHRVIAFDRPGFGHSERPRARIWTPQAQAALLAEALAKLKVERAIIVGHSFGTMVTLALALDHPQLVERIVLLGGYYFPSARMDVLVGGQPAIPGVGDVMRYTVSPLIGAAMTPKINDKLFDPAPVAESWGGFPMAMTLRPSQIRASAAEAAMMVPAAAMLAKRYGELALPITILAGSGDRIVDIDDQSKRLHIMLPHSRFVAVEGAGHMVHHTAPDKVLRAIEA